MKQMRMVDKPEAPEVLGAITPERLEIEMALYKRANYSIYANCSSRLTEIVKILENTYRLINISLINELSMIHTAGHINMRMPRYMVIKIYCIKPP